MIQKVISAAVAELGYTEGANNFNKFAPLVGHRQNQAWCASFVIACFKAGGEEKAILNSPSVIEIWKWGEKNHRLYSKNEAKRGDLIGLDFNGDGIPEHIELAIHDWNDQLKQVQTIGGNTGSKSEANGEGVFKKNRMSQHICFVLRPKWSQK